MRSVLMILLFPVLLAAQDSVYVLRDGPVTGHNPGLIIEFFVERPYTVYDTTGWVYNSKKELVPTLKGYFQGLALGDFDSTTRTRPIILRRYQAVRIHWDKADTTIFIGTLPDRQLKMKERFLSNHFWQSYTVVPDSLKELKLEPDILIKR